jgi:cell division protein FtsA
MKKSIFSDQVTVAIDIGTTKICVLVSINNGDKLDIIGIGKSPSDGLSKGVVVDINRTVASIKNALKEAELMADYKIESACIGISGGHIKSRSSQGMVPIKRGEIKASDIAQVVAAARAVAVPEGHQILHVLPQYFIIDGQEKVSDPLGMYGVRLEALVHIITGSVASVHNLIKCCEMAGVKVTDIVLEQLASADAVLSYDEKKLGVLMVDIGGGTSDVALFYNNAIRHTLVLPVAGNHFTHDLALGLHTSIHEAERIKKEHGSVYYSHNSSDIIEVNCINGLNKKHSNRHDVVMVLHARAQELLKLIQKDLVAHSLQFSMPAGIVLTGGGALLSGMQELAHSMFKVPVRLGNPQLYADCGALLNNPIYSTGYGLLLHAHKKQTTTMTRLAGPLVMRIMGRMKSWMGDMF